jgi:gliding motility-associated-like protein
MLAKKEISLNLINMGPKNRVSGILNLSSFHFLKFYDYGTSRDKIINRTAYRILRQAVNLLLSVIILTTFSSVSFGQTNYYSKSSGNLELLSTWGQNTDGSGAAPINFTSNDQVFNVRNNATLTIGANWTVSGINSMIIIGDGTNPCTLTIPGALVLTGTTEIASNGTLKVVSTAATPYSGALTVDNGGSYEHARDGGTIPTATWNSASNCNITGLTASTVGGLTLQTFGNLNYSSSYALNLAGNLTVAGNLSITGGSIAATTRTISLTGNLTGTNNLSFTTGILNIGGSFSNSGVFTCGTCTVNYNGAAAQQVKATTYNTLNISGSGIKTLQGDITVSGNLGITGGTLNLGTTATTISVTGSTTINSATGGLDFGTVSSKTFTANGSLALTSGTIDMSGATLNILDLKGNANTGGGTLGACANNPEILYSAAGAQNVIALNYCNLTLSGSGTKTLMGATGVSNNLAISGTAILYSNTFQITGNATGTFTMGAGTTLNLGNTGTATAVLFPTNFTAAKINLDPTSTVTYQANISQTVSNIPTYGNLNISTNGTTKTCDGNLTVNGNLAINGTAAFSAGTTGSAWNISGNVTIDGTLDFGTAAVKTISISGNLIDATGTLTMQGAGLSHILNLNGANNAITAFNTTAASGSIVNYNRAGDQQVFVSANYRNLNLVGSGIKTFNAGNSTVNDNLAVTGCTLAYNSGAVRTINVTGNLSGDGTIDMSTGPQAHILNLGGSTNNIGTLTTNSTSNSAVNYTGGGAQTVFGSPNYRNLSFSGGGLKSLQGNVTVNNSLTLTSGLTFLGNNDLTIGNGATSSAGTVTAMVITDGTGQMKKIFPSGASAFTFPVGDNSISNDYSPTTITYTANSTIRTIGVIVTDTQHPSDGTATDYISRYWTFTDNQAGTYAYNASFTYSIVAPSDLVGLYANLRVNRWDGSLWTQYTTSGAAPTITATAINETNATLNNSSFTGRVNVPIYTWNQTGATADFQIASNWTPSRLSPQPTDILQFDNNGITTATNVPTQTIGNLVISNGSNVTLQAGAASTLTVGNVAGTDLTVNSGTILSLGTNVNLTMAGSATSTIDGTLNVGSTSTFTTNAALSVTTVTGSGIVNNSGAIAGSATGLIFNSGSNYNHTRDAGTIPTAGWNAASNCNLTGLTTTAPLGLGQSFGNVNYNSAYVLSLSGNLTVTGSLDISGGSIDANIRTITLAGNLTGTNNLAFTTAGILNIGGNYSNTGLFTCGTGSTVNYNGAAQDVKSTTYYNLTISGSGDKTMLGDVTVGRTATFTAGALNLNGNILNLVYGTGLAAGTLTGSNTSSIVITGAGTPAMSLPVINGGLQNLTINKTGATNTVTLGSNLNIVGAANFTAGGLTLGGRTLDLQGTTTVGAGTIAGSAASSLIVSSGDNSGLILPNITGGLLDFTVNKTGTTNTVTLGGALTTAGTISLSNGTLLLNNFLLTINGSLSLGTGSMTGGGTSDITIGTPAGAAISLPAVTNGIRNLGLNRTAGLTLTGDNTVTGTLTLTSGKITLGTYNLTLSGAAAVGGVSALNYIIADGTGQLKKVFAAGATAAYTLPVGDVSGDYSPVSLTFTANSVQRTIGVHVTDALHPNDGGSSDNISRYWSFADDLAGGTYTYNASFTFISPADLTGLYANLRVNRWDGSAWTQYTTTGVSPVLTITGVTETTAPFNNSDFTGRVQGVMTYNWNQTGVPASFTTPANWTPARLSPQPTDILIFDNNGITTASNVPSQTIGKLIVSNGTDIRLISGAAAQTLTVSGGTGIDLDVQNGTTLRLSSAGANQIGIVFNPATQDASIAGTLIIDANGPLTNSYSATNSNTVVTGTMTNNGGTITSTAANLNFNAGSFYNHNRNNGTIPTATWNTLSTCSIGTGFTGTAPAGLNQTFGNFTMDAAGNTLTLAGALAVGNDLNINNGTIAAGGNTINLTRHLTGAGTLTFGAGTLNIGGDNTNTGTFTCGTGIVNYNGTLQKVKGTIYNNLTISGGNTKILQGPATVNSTLTLTAGILQLGDNDLTIANSTIAIAGSPFDATKMIETNGTGSLIRSSTSNNNTFNLTYPVGSGTFYNPLIISALPANAAVIARSISVRAVPSNPMVLSNSINKYWDLIATNITTGAQVLSFTYNAGEIVGDPLLFQPFTNTSGSWILATGPSGAGANPATSTGSATLTGSWTVGSSSTFYSYQTGPWDMASTWTFDPGGTTGPGTTIPGDNDKVVILSGRTVTLQNDVFSNSLDITINNGGFLDLGTYQYANPLKALRGDGVLKLNSSSFPTATTNTFVSTDGGTTEYNVTGDLSPTQSLYYHLTINSAGTVVQINDITLNGNLNVKQGVYQINNAVARRLKLIINGDVTVDNTGSIRVGTGGTRSNPGPMPSITGNTGAFLNYYELNSHRIQVYGNFTNNGVIRFSNLTYPIYNQFPANGFATVYFNGSADKTLTCNGQTDFYNLVVDKGTDQTFKLTVQSSAYNNFRLFGANTSDGSSTLPATSSSNPNIKKSLWIKDGTLVLQGLVAIPSLSEGSTNGIFPNYPSDFFIPANGALLLDGVGVIVLATADSYTEVNAAYGLAGGSDVLYGINSTGGYSGISNLGKLQVNNGYLSTRESSGLNYWRYASGQYIINGGKVDTKQFHNAEGGILELVSFVQTGGTLVIRGRFTTNISYVNPADLANATINTARIANGIDGAAGIGAFSINSNAANGFSMSGGTISFYDVCNNTATPLAILIDCPASNINVTGGTVNLIPTTGSGLPDADYLINSRGSFYNMNINRASGTSAVQLNTNPLTVLNDFSLTSGVLTSNNMNLSVGGNLVINSGTTYNAGSNTTILNGSANQTFTVNLAAPLSVNKLTVDKTAGIILNFAGSQSVINVGSDFRLVSGTMNDSGKTINIAGNVFNSGIHSGTGKIVLNGTAVQTIDGNGTFGNIDLFNTNGATAPVSLLAGITINGTLNFANDKLFNINTQNVTLNSAASLQNVSGTRYFKSAGNAGDGGLTKVFSSSSSFIYPLGVANFTPAALTINGTPSSYGSITVIPVNYEHPNVTTTGRSLTYFWRTKSSGFDLTGGSITHKYTYADPNIVTGAGITEDGYVAARFDVTTSTWTKGVQSDVDEGNNIIGGAGSLGFLEGSAVINGDYTAGDDNPVDPFGLPTTYYSRQSGLWKDGNTWSLTGHGGAPAGAWPGASDIAKIGTGHTINLYNNPAYPLNTATVSCSTLQIEAGGILDIGNNPGSVFSMVQSNPTGNGIFRLTSTRATAGVPISEFAFPAGDFSDFNVNLGTTDFYTTTNLGTSLYILPPISYVGNMIMSPLGNAGSGDNMVLQNVSSLTIYGDLTLNGASNASAIGLSWNTNDAFYAFSNKYVTVEKTVTIRGNLNINGGALTYYDDDFPQHLVVNGNINISSATNGACIIAWDSNNGWIPNHNGPSLDNTLTIGGNIVNNGTASGIFNGLNLYWNDATPHYVDIMFTGSNNATVTGTGAVNYHEVTVNKGTSQTPTLTISSTGTHTTPVNNWLTLQNGTLVYNRTGNLPISTSSAFAIAPTAGLTVNTPSNVYIGNLNSDANDLILNGKLTLINGNVYVGQVAAPVNNNDIEYSVGGASEIDVQGGALFVNGQIRRNTSSAGGILKYSQSGGSVTVRGQNQNGTNAKFEVVNTGSTFNMSNGTLTIVRGNGATTTPSSPFGDLYLRPETGSVTGGTIIFSQGGLAAPQNYFLDATIPLNNLTITGTSAANYATVRLLISPLTINGDMTISANSNLDANNINATFNGNFINTPGAAGYAAGTNLTTFSASNSSPYVGAQTITGVTNFYDLTVSPGTSVTLINSSTVSRNLTLSTGTLKMGANSVTVLGDVVNDASYTDNGTAGTGLILNGTALQHISGLGAFARLTLNNANGARIENDITVQEDLTLTLGILDIKKYLFTMGVNSNLQGAPFGATKMITSDGVFSNVGLRKFFNPGATIFLYPIGTAGKYTPALLTTTASSSVGYLRINNISSRHPSVLDATNSLDYYWEVQSSGITGYDGTLELNYLQSDVAGDEPNYMAARITPPGTAWTVYPGVNQALNKITTTYTGSNNLSGEYTAGIASAFFTNIPIYTTNADGFWDDESIWTQTGGDPFPCPSDGPNGFIVNINHVVTVRTNDCSAYRTTINKELRVEEPYFGHNFGTVYGNGILYLERGTFPAGVYTSFLSCAGNATVDYGGTGTYTIIADLYDNIPNLLFTGTGTRVLPNKDLTICDTLTVNGPVVDNSVYNKKLTIQGGMKHLSGTFNSGTGAGAIVSFAGTAAQKIGGTLMGDFTGASAFNHFEINNASGLRINDSGALEVKGNLLLTSGLINTGENRTITVTNSAINCIVPSGGSATSFIDGPLTKRISQYDNFLFPIGIYKVGFGSILGNRLTISSTQTGPQLWTSEYKNPNPTSTSMTPPLQGVSAQEFYTIKATAGSQARVNINWTPTTDVNGVIAGGMSNIRVANYNGSSWIEVPTTPSGNNNNGTASTTSVVTFTGSDDYTMGSITNLIPRASLTPTGPVCGFAGIPVTFTAPLPIPFNYLLSYTINGAAQTPITITPAMIPYTLPTTIPGTYKLTDFIYNNGANVGVVDGTPVTAYATPTTANAGTDQALCGITTVNLAGNTPVIGTGRWSVVGGTLMTPSSPTSQFIGLNGSSYTLSWTISNGTCISTDDVVISFTILPDPPAAASPQTFCDPSTIANLVATAPVGCSVDWYNAASAGVLLPPATALVSGTTYYAESNGGCVSLTRTPVAVTIYTRPVPSLNGPNSVCVNSTGNLYVTDAGKSNYVWVVSGGFITAGGTSTSSTATVTWNSIGARTISVNYIDAGGCTAITPTVYNVTVNAEPTITLGSNPTVCSGTTTASLSYSATTGSPDRYSIDYDAAANAVGFVDLPITTVLTASPISLFVPGAAPAGTYMGTLTVMNSGTGCISGTYPISVTINTLATPTFTTAPGANTCIGANATYTTQPAMTNYTWTVPGTLGTDYNITAGGISATDNTVTLTWLTTGSKIVTVNYNNVSGCTGSSPASNTTTVNALPTPTFTTAPGANTCVGTSVTYTTQPAMSNYTWTVPGTLGTDYNITAGGISATDNTVTLTWLTTGGKTVTVNYTNGSGCTGSSPASNTTTVNVLPTPTFTAQPGANTCASTDVTYTTQALQSNYIWTIPGVAGIDYSVTSGGTNADNSITLQWLTTGNKSLSVNYTNSNGCTAASPTTSSITLVTAGPTTANAGTDQTGASTCGLTMVTLAANNPAIGTGSWSIFSGIGGTITAPTSPSSTFTGTAGLTYVLRWTITNPPCPPSTDDVTITFNQNPSIANAGLDQTGASMCGLTSTTLTANTPLVGTGTWTIQGGAGGNILSPNSPTSTFTGTAGTAYVLRWTVSNPPCPDSFEDVNITFHQNPTTANAGPDQTGASTCGLTTVTLAANNPAVGTGSWSIFSGAGGSLANPSLFNSTFTGVAGSTYVLRWTITNPPCPASFEDVTITFNQNPTIANAGPDQTGAATCGLTTVNLAANTPAIGIGAWSIIGGTGGSIADPADPVSTFSGVAGNSYTLRWTITSGACTPSTEDVNITFNQNPTVADAGPDQTGVGMCGMTLTTLAANTPATGSGTWSIVSGAGGNIVAANSPTSTFSGTAGTTYVLRWTITNPPCLPSTDDVTITFNQNPTPTFTAQPGANACAGTDVTYTTQAGQFNYVWSVPGTLGTDYTITSGGTATDNSVILKWLSAGSKIVTVNYSNAAGCSGPVPASSIPTTVNVSVPVSVTVAADANPVCAGTTVNFTATPVNGGATPSYQWQVNGVNAGINSSTYSYIPVNGDVVTVILTSNAACPTGNPATSAPVTMTVNPTVPVSVTIVASANPVCAGTAMTFTATPINGGATPSYQWYNGATAVGTDSPTYNYTPANGDIITVVLTSGLTCQSGGPATSNAITMTVNPVLPVSVTIVADANPVCAGTTVNFTATPVNGGTTPSYQWQVNGINAGINSSTYSYIPVNGDLVTVILTSNETCPTGNPAISAPVTMTVNPTIPVSVTVVADANPVCAGNTVNFTATPVNGGTTPSYQWQVNGVNAGINNNIYSYIPVNGDVVTVILTSNETCPAGNPATSAPVTMTVNLALPVSVTITADANPVCAGTTVNFTATPVNGGTTPSYQWQVNGVNAGINSSTFSYIPVNGDAVTVILTSDAACPTGNPATSAPVTMTVNSIPTLIITDPSAACSPATVDITASSVTAGSTAGLTLTYWTDIAATIVYATPAAATAGTYYIKGSDPVTGCYNIKPVIVIVNPAPSGSTAVTNVLCNSASTGAVDLTVSGGTSPFTFSWSNGATSEDIASVAAGTYTVTITDANLCTAVASGTVTEPATAVSGTESHTDVTVYGGNDGSLTATGSGGVPPYMYSLNGGAYQASGAFISLAAGPYTITVQDANLCTFNIAVTINQPLVPLSGNFSQTNVLCFGSSTGSITATGLFGTPPYEYSLNGGPYQSSGTFSSLVAGPYTVTVRDALPSTFNMAITITQPAAPLTVATTQTNVLCNGAKTGTATATPAGGTSPYTYSWNTTPVQTAATATGLDGGSYTVIVTDANGCTQNASVTISQPAALSVTTTQTNVLCNGQSNGTATAVPAGGTGPYSYSWNTLPVQTTATATGLAAGSYTVTVTDANGCTTPGNVTITQPAALSLDLVPSPASCPNEANGSVTLTITGGTGPFGILWADGDSTQKLTDLLPGTYSVIVTDANSCATSLSTDVGYIGSYECLSIPNIITPNGDGFNDEWVIKNIDIYPNAEIKVYTRWGKLVYKSRNVSADPWDGRFNGKLLPTDSYHYILMLGDGSDPRSGVISIIR